MQADGDDAGTGRTPFRDRHDAGAQLAERLMAYRDQQTLVLGIPRGGVVVAAEIAARLRAELDIVVARKLGAPGNPELAIGAVTATGDRYLNQSLLQALHVSPQYLAEVTTAEQMEAQRREQFLRGTATAPAIAGRTVIVADDGLATGATMIAALRAVQQQRPRRLIAAVPVAAPEACGLVRDLADELVCLLAPPSFYAVGLYYQQFGATDAEELQHLMAKARRDQALRNGSG